MTELKTLKDLGWGTDGEKTSVNHKDLRQEAIKHIKDIKRRACGQSYSTELLKRSRIDWIKMFFNITEDDLNV